MRKAVLFFASYGAPYEGNFIPSLRMLSRKLHDEGIDSILFLPEKVRQYPWTQSLNWCSEVIFFQNSIPGDAAQIAEQLKKHSVLLVHTHFAESKHIISLKLGMLLAGKNVPIVEHHHQQFPFPSNPLKKAVKFSIMKNDYLLGCGESVAESIRRSGISNSVDFVDNALDFSRLGSFTRSSSNQNLLMFGFDVQRKGVDLALLACKKLIDEFPRLQLHVCVAVEMEQAKAFTKQVLGELPAWLIFLPPTNTIADYYQNAAIFLSPSRKEGLCYSVIEAAYCRCAVIGSDIDGIHDIRLPSMKLFPSENIDALADAIREVLTMQETEYLALTDRLHQEAMEYYQLNRWAEEMMDYFHRYGLIV